jgi:hypothetical protein
MANQNTGKLVPEIPYPSDELTRDLIPIDFEREVSWGEAVDGKVQSAMAEINGIESAVLDIIGAQMEVVSQSFEETIRTTRELFAALVRLNEGQAATLEEKRANATELLRKLEMAMGFIRKL